MIKRLRRRIITISAISVFSVILLVFSFILVFNVRSTNSTLDSLADAISSGDGRFPDFFGQQPPPAGEAPMRPDGAITPETRFSTRHFTVWLTADGTVERVNTEFIHSIDDDTAVEYANRAASRSGARGWIDSYRYKVYPTDGGTAVVFVDGNMSRLSMNQSVVNTGLVLLVSGLVVLLLIIIFSNRAIEPIAVGYERQKQFVTDANHELKTPLTLILANVDIAEAELGKNEWLDDIRSEGRRMADLVNRLVTLSRLDEDAGAPSNEEVNLSDLALDTYSEFVGLATSRGLSVTSSIDEGVMTHGDEALLRSIVAILLDNAVKYCDAGGEISLTLHGGRHTVLTVVNDYAAVDSIDLERLFDRFYRVDKARTYTGGYGIGLSIARAAAERHRADLTALSPAPAKIAFRLAFRR